MLPAISRFHAYTRNFGKKDILNYTDTPHSWANNKLGMTFWEVLNSDPHRVQEFARGLSLFDAIHPVVGIYPFEEQHAAGNSPHRTLAVDIGGGRGLAMLELRTHCPGLKGNLILEDRQEVLNAISVEELPGVEKIQHDFFSPQPVKGAQIYYIRRVFHDWLDEEARKILTSIVPAMAPDSRILISDMALPEPITFQDAHAVWLDLMMLTIGGKERTKKDWESLVESAGLKLVKFWQKPEYAPLVVVECALPDAATEIGTETQNKINTENRIANQNRTVTAEETAEVTGLANGVAELTVNGNHEENHLA
jgi:O-methyltransferase domain